MEKEMVVDSDGDRFADIVECVNLRDSLTHVMGYVERKAGIEPEETTETKDCLKMLQEMSISVDEQIGGIIE